MAGLSTLQVHLLGGFRVIVNECAVPPGSWRQKAAASIVKLLALAPSHRLHREQLIDILWPDLDADAQANNLNVAVSRARQALVGTGAPAGMFLMRTGDLLALGPTESIWVDVDAFEEAVILAWRSHDPDVHHRALALYTGDLLAEDLYEDWVDGRRTALRTSYLTLLTRLAGLFEQHGELGRAIEVLQRIVAIEPTHEETHVALMRLYALTGQKRLALAQYTQLATILDRELNTEPDRAVGDLAAAIREGRFPDAVRPLEIAPAAPAAPVVSIPTNLPNPLSSLIGREREIAELQQLVATARLVTLTGTGGIGKTRLAIAVGHAAKASFPDGVFVVDLAPIRDPGLIVAAIAQALDVRERAEQPWIETVKAFLQDRRVLLILDNFEQLVDAAPVVTELLEHCPQARALVTSRMRLRLRGEHEYPIPPLALPDAGRLAPDRSLLNYSAVALFVERAREVKPDLQVTNDTAAAIAAVCHRLDGLPLAIELAATRSKALTPYAMLARLDRPLALLTGGARDLPIRQKTIRNTIQWSYDLLEPGEQRLFLRLSVFVGGWTREAAEAVADQDGELGIEVRDGLMSLADKSLITQQALPDGEVRYGMLETIREFALGQLKDAHESVDIQDRHARYYLDFAEQAFPELIKRHRIVWVRRLDADHDNLRAACTWLFSRDDIEPALRLVSALGRFWMSRSYLGEGRQWLEYALRMSEGGTSAARLQVLSRAGQLALWQGDYERAISLLEESLAQARDIGDTQQALFALVGLSITLMEQGHLERASAYSGEALAFSRETHDQLYQALVPGIIGHIALLRGDVDQADQCFAQGFEFAQATDKASLAAGYLPNMGFAALSRNDLTTAVDLFRRSLIGNRDLLDDDLVVESVEGVAAIAAVRNQPGRAVRLFAAASQFWEDIGSPVPLILRSLREQYLPVARDQLSSALYDTGWAEGRAMSIDEAIAYALELSDS